MSKHDPNNVGLFYFCLLLGGLFLWWWYETHPVKTHFYRDKYKNTKFQRIH